ncbi:MAG: EAL domain-containing protein [Blautia sp.]|nr:EAL domain-containing protein [Blautia sp.]
MTLQDLWNDLGLTQEIQLAEELSRMPYDELIEINLSDGSFHTLRHVSNKYMGNVLKGDFSQLCFFALKRFIHPEDRKAFEAFSDLATMRDRLSRGFLTGRFRFKGTDGSWIETSQLLVSGEELGFGPDIVRCYVFDLKPKTDHSEPEAVSLRAEEITGIMEGTDFFRYVEHNLTKYDGSWCILDIIIEKFKLFVDWYGVGQGRYLLTEAGDLLKEKAGEMGGYAGYLGQEGFVLVLPFDQKRIADLFTCFRTLTNKIGGSIDGFTPRIGIARINSPHIMESFNDAGLALEENLRDMHCFVHYYNPVLHQETSQEYRLAYDFLKAFDRNEITFYIQPQCIASNHRIVGGESLARWKKNGTFISPAEFIPVLERHDLITRLDLYLMEAVCQWLRSWIDQGHEPVPISVNISRIDIQNLDIPRTCLNLVERYGLKPKYLEIEITESAYVENGAIVTDTVTRLQDAGFKVLMDDFGSGYSSLNMLRSINVDVIKLDAQFLQISKKDEQKGLSILDSIINLTRNLGTPVIIEGVETQEQFSYLRDLGCRYMQGFYFYKPMEIPEFERLISEKSHIDFSGLVFKSNEQLHVREFLDENIYSDVMLNNILGAVCFYHWHGEDVDIIRYNQQFFELVGIDTHDFSQRQTSIQKYLHPDDRKKFFDILQESAAHHATGAKGVIRVYRPNHVLVWISLSVYYIGRDAEGILFYGSSQDVTESQSVDADIPGGYLRTTLGEGYEFLYIGKHFMEMTGYSKAEIRFHFDYRLINMIHPKDREGLAQDIQEIWQGSRDTPRPYRLKTKKGGYIYVVEQCRLTDFYGAPCWQSVLLEITDIMRSRNQMRVLSQFLTDSILLLHRYEQNLVYEVAVHGLESTLGLDQAAFERLLNSGEFCHWIEGHKDIPHREYTERFIAGIDGSQKELLVHVPSKGDIRLCARADRVDDGTSIAYIVVLRLL